MYEQILIKFCIQTQKIVDYLDCLYFQSITVDDIKRDLLYCYQSDLFVNRFQSGLYTHSNELEICVKVYMLNSNRKSNFDNSMKYLIFSIISNCVIF